MKSCPACRATYSKDFTHCTRDGTSLVEVDAWFDGALIRGKYRILSKIGERGMAAVYKALHIRFDELRALKVINAELSRDPEFVQRLTQEAVVTRRLQHPNAVRVEDIDEAEDGRPFIVMEYVEGRTLEELIEESPQFSVDRTCSIVKQVALALDAAHALGILHRDIKPANIALVESPEGEQAKVLDFGIAKAKETKMGETVALTLTGKGRVVGTAAYMSPEQAKGMRGDELDGRSDLYSLGVVMYQMLSGELPLKAKSEMSMVTAHIETPPTPIRALRPDIPEFIANLVMRCLERDRELRPRDGRALIEEIEHWERGEVAASTSVFEPEQTVRYESFPDTPMPAAGAISDQGVSGGGGPETSVSPPRELETVPAPSSGPGASTEEPFPFLSATALASDFEAGPASVPTPSSNPAGSTEEPVRPVGATMRASEFGQEPESVPGRSQTPAANVEKLLRAFGATSFDRLGAKPATEPQQSSLSPPGAEAAPPAIDHTTLGSGSVISNDTSAVAEPRAGAPSGVVVPIPERESTEQAVQVIPPVDRQTARVDKAPWGVWVAILLVGVALGVSVAHWWPPRPSPRDETSSKPEPPPHPQPLPPSYPSPGTPEGGTGAVGSNPPTSPEPEAEPRESKLIDRTQLQALKTEGDQDYANGSYDDAIRRYRKGLSLDPGNAELLQEIKLVRRAKDAEKSVPGPISEAELIKLLRGYVLPDRVATLAKERNASFPITQEVERLLREAGANDALVATLKQLAPKPSGPILEIHSTPGDTQVYVDDAPAGTTDAEGLLKLRALEPGDHKVRLSLENFNDFEVNAQLRLGATTLLEAKLRPVPPATKPESPPAVKEPPMVLVGKLKTFEGTVSDDDCTTKHEKGTADDIACVKKCMKSGKAKYVLVTKELLRKRAYQLEPQSSFVNFAGERVRVQGIKEGDLIKAQSVDKR